MTRGLWTRETVALLLLAAYLPLMLFWLCLLYTSPSPRDRG